MVIENFYVLDLCAEGYYCVSGMDRPEPDGDNSTATGSWCYNGRQTGYGGRCPAGHYCERGSSFPVPCEAGTYAASEGQSTCETCVAGKKSCVILFPISRIKPSFLKAIFARKERSITLPIRVQRVIIVPKELNVDLKIAAYPELLTTKLRENHRTIV